MQNDVVIFPGNIRTISNMDESGEVETHVYGEQSTH